MSIEYSSSNSSKSVDPLGSSFQCKVGNIQYTYEKFEMMGLLYSHCMRVFRQLDVMNIFEKYLLL
ncbi:hypothetical protein IEQ34_020734 [Dendrobium chrysotoxum]|uniref:Uncharacterized protein n=1 Tax=Dendrobium chrysotoxum TaxID=161865 RepID=A0AAV7G1J6_DENCH|nr:hypothetical protein IEQ34_020734 [Dendrobium chrysotoxum]